MINHVRIELQTYFLFCNLLSNKGIHTWKDEVDMLSRLVGVNGQKCKIPDLTYFKKLRDYSIAGGGRR